MSKKTSRVWLFFDEIEGDSGNKVKCNQCQSVISRGGRGKAANTTSMNNHIKFKHSELLPQLSAKIKNISSTVAAFSEPKPSSSSSQSTISSGAGTSRQQSIEDCLSPLWSINDAKSKEIHIFIGKMIALDNQPFSCVENIGFRNLIKKLKPKYDMPSRKYFADNIIPRLYDDTKSEIKKGVLDAAAISVTSDLWTNTNNFQSFVSFG